MRRRNITIAIVLLGLYVAVAGLLIWSLADNDPLPVGPSKAKLDKVQPVGPSRGDFDKVRIGMTLAEAEAFLGPAGPSYSSDTNYEYYIWKGKDGWSRAWVRQGRISERAFDPIRTDRD
jgi:hypothetical protein